MRPLYERHSLLQSCACALLWLIGTAAPFVFLAMHWRH